MEDGREEGFDLADDSTSWCLEDPVAEVEEGSSSKEGRGMSDDWSGCRRIPRTDRIAEVPDVVRIDPSSLEEEVVRRREVDPSFECEEETSFVVDGSPRSLALDLVRSNELEVPFRTDLLASSPEKVRPNDRCIPVDLLLPTYPPSMDLDALPTFENRLGSRDLYLCPCLGLDLPPCSPSESLVVVPGTSPNELG